MATQQQPHDDAPHPADRQGGTAVATRNANVPAVPGSAGLPVAPGETSSSAIAAREKAAVEARFLVAMNRPREFETSRLRLLKSCNRPLFAEVARYAKPVGGGSVTGLSVRFAEEARVLWGNMDVTTMVVSDTDERRIYRVTGVDLETNATDSIDVIVEKFVERRQVRSGMEVIGQRMNTTGQVVYKIRATEDDLIVKANAQISKAKRNVILSLLPGDVKEECEIAIVETQKRRDAEDPDAAKRAVLDAFFSIGVMPVQIADLLGHAVEQITPAELGLLRGYYTAIRDGEATYADIVELHSAGKKSAAEPAGKAGTDARGSEGLKSRMGAASASAESDKSKAPTLVKGVECGECGAKKGEPHKSACPLAE